ncbi:galactose-3-O-sulfotransferase 2-like [Amphiura filiformis]|uniref:galactose-3-O-sulfotransferase 2-like n=1 Tax=Amphiura filiformis TaxID=82378 RepID=UPI003B223CDC
MAAATTRHFTKVHILACVCCILALTLFIAVDTGFQVSTQYIQVATGTSHTTVFGYRIGTPVQNDVDSIQLDTPLIQNKNDIYSEAQNKRLKTKDLAPPESLALPSTAKTPLQKTSHHQCQSPTTNVAFIKTHKTGSTTLEHIINRYGYARNLSFVLNTYNPQNGHLSYQQITEDSPKTLFLPPIGVTQHDFEHFKYDMVAVHLRYNRTAMDTFMKPGTKYITIIRDPGYQFESAFSHFQMDDAYGEENKVYNTTQERIVHFLQNPEYYREKLKDLMWEYDKGTRWYYARNNQIFDLGFEQNFGDDTTQILRYLERLDQELDLVLITEYFDESMLLLKYSLCWSMDDIIYVAKNVRPEREEISESLRQNMRRWNTADTILYEHFNQTLWRKIKEIGPRFQNDLLIFKNRMKETFETCGGGKEK